MKTFEEFLAEAVPPPLAPQPVVNPTAQQSPSVNIQAIQKMAQTQMGYMQHYTKPQKVLVLDVLIDFLGVTKRDIMQHSSIAGFQSPV